MEVFIDQFLHVFLLHLVRVVVVIATLLLVEVVVADELLERDEDGLSHSSQVFVEQDLTTLIDVWVVLIVLDQIAGDFDTLLHLEAQVFELIL